MIRGLRRLGAFVVVGALLTPIFIHSAAAEPARPAAWLALRSYQRLEQRLREVSTMAKTPGLADMMLGLVQLQLAGLGGLDRQRPIGVVVPTVSLSGPPPVVVLLPYTEREGILQTLRGIYPQLLVENGEKLSLQGGPIPAFGRLDTQANLLLVASTPEALQGDTVTLPPDLLGSGEEGPDLVLRVDMETVKQQLDVVWKGMITSMEQGWQKALQKAMDDQAISAAEKTAMTAYMTLSQKTLRQLLDDLAVAESRLTLAPKAWVWDLEAKMRPGSSSAAFVNAQSGQTARVGQLFTPHPEALMRLVYNVRMTEDLRQSMTALLPTLRQMLEAKLAASPTLTAEQRTAGAKVVEAYFGLIEQWYTQPALEAAGEMRTQGTSFEMSAWVPFPDSTRALGTVLDVMEKIPLFTPQAPAKVARDIGKHQGTALHRVDILTAAAPDVPPHMFLAAPGPLLAIHLGKTADALQGLIDRVRTLTPQATTPTDALAHVEIFVAPMLTLGMNKGQMGKGQDPTLQALVARLKQGVNEPFAIDVLTRQSAATLRYTLPGTLVQAFAEVVGQQITQQMQGGGEKKSGGEKKNGANKPTKK